MVEFNEITVLKIQDTKTLVSYDFLDCSLLVERLFDYEYKDQSTAYQLDNGIYYSKTERMAETPMPFTARLKPGNDYDFKRFLNRNGARFKLFVTENGVPWTIFCEAGDQTAQVDFGVIKKYNFVLKSTTRPMITTIFESKDTPPQIFPGSDYDTGNYDEAKYSTMGSVNNPVKATFNGIMVDVNSYFEVIGQTKGENISMYINGTTINIANTSSDIPFYYSNLPDEKTIMLNNVERIDLLDATRTTNFEFNFKQSANVITVTGLLSGAQIIVYSGGKVV